VRPRMGGSMTIRLLLDKLAGLSPVDAGAVLDATQRELDEARDRGGLPQAEVGRRQRRIDQVRTELFD
jgi:hypothetical protein